MVDNWDRVKKRISERTDLTDDLDLEVYTIVCGHSDSEDGVIMYGDVVFDIAQRLREDLSLPMKALDRAYNEGIGNHVNETLQGEKICSLIDRSSKGPVHRMAEKVLGEKYHKFMKMHLIRPPQQIRLGDTPYPILNGYNFYNDNDFYKKTADGNLRVSVR